MAVAAMLIAPTLSVAIVGAAPANADPGDSGYKIVNALSRLNADVMNASTNINQPVILWHDNTSRSQRFDLVDVGRRLGGGSSIYTIVAQHSHLCLGVAGLYSWGNGARVVQEQCAAPPGVSRYVAARLMAAVQWHTEHVQFQCSLGSPGQPCFNASRTILVNRGTGRCLDAANPNYPARPTEQARLQVWDCVTSGNATNIGNQWWDLKSVVSDIPPPR